MEIAVISGKGGTGKSSVCAAFITIAQKAIAIDCDVDASNLYLLFSPIRDQEYVFVSGYQAVIDSQRCNNCGLCLESCRFGAITLYDEEIKISETSCEGCFLCSRICPTQAIEMLPADKSRFYVGTFRYGKMVYGYLAPGEENSGKLVSKIRRKAHEEARKNGCDTLIIDGPPGIGCSAISTITGVDRVVVVTEPSLSAFHDLQRIIIVVRQFSLPIFVIINKCDLNLTMTIQIERWCQDENIPVVAHLPFDIEVVKAMVAEKTIVEYQPDHKIVKLLQNAYYQIIKN
ncbi:MAG: ATP-binding protein [Bacteroidaceae bacterium]|nr:ATP-binding protein [Bacteroidaceae bacterium]